MQVVKRITIIGEKFPTLAELICFFVSVLFFMVSQLSREGYQRELLTNKATRYTSVATRYDNMHHTKHVDSYHSFTYIYTVIIILRRDQKK